MVLLLEEYDRILHPRTVECWLEERQNILDKNEKKYWSRVQQSIGQKYRRTADRRPEEYFKETESWMRSIG